MDNPTTAYDIIADLEGRLEKCKRTGDKLRARCPAHEDKTPSLDVEIGDNGDCVVLICRAHCTAEAVVEALGWTMRDLFATDDTWRSHEASEIVHESTAATVEDASPLPSDVPGLVQTWIASLQAADLEGKIRILHIVAAAPEWQQLSVELRIAVVGVLKIQTVRQMATSILGRFDDRTLAWRDPPGKVEDTSEPDVVSLATLLANPLETTAVVARGLAFGGTLGFIRGPKASGKTTILAAAAARVSQGQPWAGHDTEAGTVLVVTDDDPRSWTLALRDFRANTERILMARARVVSKPGKLAALLAEHTPAWVIIDNLRTWCRSMQLDTDNSSAAADAIDPIAEAIRECGYPVACSILHNEARSKGVTNDPYAGRMRNSTVFEDAADWIVGCAHVDGSTETTITSGEKTRRGIPTETLTIDLSADGHGTPTTGGGGADPFTVTTPANPLDAKIREYIMANPEGVSQNAVLKAVGGRRPRLVNRLKVVGTLGPDNLWRCATQPGIEAKPSRNDVVLDDGITPKEQVRPEAQTVGGENRDAVGCVPVSPANGTQGGTHCVPTSHPIRDAPSGPTSGTHLGTHLAAPDLLALTGAKTTTAPTPRGGSVTHDGQVYPLSIPTPPGGEPAEKGDAHDAECPGGCGGSGAVDGKPCNWPEDRKRRLREEAPTTHTTGVKRWDDSTSTWVETIPNDDWWMPGRDVHLSDRTTVTDGDPDIHWDMTWTDTESDRDEAYI